MKERPILFSAPMVNAILNGTKTQTRRIVKNPIPPNAKSITRYLNKQGNEVFGFRLGTSSMLGEITELANIKCPYGKPCDRLWVRETFLCDTNGFIYRADGDFEGNAGILGGWKPSIHMPRSASRIDLEITGIRVERLQDISEEDAIAEGVERDRGGWKSYEIIHSGKHNGERSPLAAFPNQSPLTSYIELWESINGSGSWDFNPFVWVVEFKRIQSDMESA